MEKKQAIIPVSFFVEDGLKGLGMNLYMLRHTRQLSLENFANIIQEDKSTIEKIELGQYTPDDYIDLGLILKIIQYFDARMEISVF